MASEQAAPCRRAPATRQCLGHPYFLCQPSSLPSTSLARCYALQANARDALAAGAFGVPSMLVTFEAGRTGQQQQEQQGQQGREQQQVLVFGSDRLEQLAFIAGKPWLGPQPQQQHLGSASRL